MGGPTAGFDGGQNPCDWKTPSDVGPACKKAVEFINGRLIMKTQLIATKEV
jgi:hypothetical protein